jgi:hypothetical protein
MLTKEFFVPVTAGNTLTSAYDTAVGDFATNTPDAAQVLYFVFKIPDNFNALSEAVMVMIPDATETIQYDLDSDYGQSGEAYTTHSETISNATAGATASQLLEVSVAGVMTLISAGDYVAIKVTSDTTQLRVIGLAIKYT